MGTSIPVVDFGQMSLDKPVKDCSVESVKQMADKIHQAFSTVGFVYIKNHGIPQEQVIKLLGLEIDLACIF